MRLLVKLSLGLLIIQGLMIGCKSKPAVPIPVVLDHPGTFTPLPFVKENNIWYYTIDNFLEGTQDKMVVEIVQKVNDYTFIVDVDIDGDSREQQWQIYRDYLLVWDEDDPYNNLLYGDTIYGASVAINDRWSGTDYAKGTQFNYEVVSTTETLYLDWRTFHNLVQIQVGSGLFSTQDNYWSRDTGFVQTFATGQYIGLDSAILN